MTHKDNLLSRCSTIIVISYAQGCVSLPRCRLLSSPLLTCMHPRAFTMLKTSVKSNSGERSYFLLYLAPSLALAALAGGLWLTFAHLFSNSCRETLIDGTSAVHGQGVFQ